MTIPPFMSNKPPAIWACGASYNVDNMGHNFVPNKKQNILGSIIGRCSNCSLKLFLREKDGTLEQWLFFGQKILNCKESAMHNALM